MFIYKEIKLVKFGLSSETETIAVKKQNFLILQAVTAGFVFPADWKFFRNGQFWIVHYRLHICNADLSDGIDHNTRIAF